MPNRFATACLSAAASLAASACAAQDVAVSIAESPSWMGVYELRESLLRRDAPSGESQDMALRFDLAPADWNPDIDPARRLRLGFEVTMVPPKDGESALDAIRNGFGMMGGRVGIKGGGLRLAWSDLDLIAPGSQLTFSAGLDGLSDPDVVARLQIDAPIAWLSGGNR